MPNYRRHYVAGHPAFVTLVTHQRRPWLVEAACARQLLGSMRRVKGAYGFRHLAHVILPDHVHWMFLPRDANFSRVVAAVKRDVSWRLKQAGDGSPPYWQDRFYDHLIRDREDLARHLDYIHYNPVRHGVTVRAADHPWSSFGEWCKRGAYEASWGDVEPDSISGLELE